MDISGLEVPLAFSRLGKTTRRDQIQSVRVQTEGGGERKEGGKEKTKLVRSDLPLQNLATQPSPTPTFPPPLLLP